MAKAVNNGKAQPGKSTASGKSEQAGKTVSKRADGKPSRSRAQAAAARTRASSSKAGEKRSISRFLREVRIELRKVSWPTRKELVQSVIVVLVFVAIATLYTFVLDTVYSRAIDLVIRAIT